MHYATLISLHYTNYTTIDELHYTTLSTTTAKAAKCNSNYFYYYSSGYYK